MKRFLAILLACWPFSALAQAMPPVTQVTTTTALLQALAAKNPLLCLPAGNYATKSTKAATIALAAICLSTGPTPATAWIHGIAGTAPHVVLRNTSIKLGALTPSANGAGFLTGIGMVDPSTSVSVTGWKVANTATNPTYWNVIGTGAFTANASAITPTPTTAGASAKLADGTYQFTVTAQGSDGSTGSATLTIDTGGTDATLANTTTVGNTISGFPGSAFLADTAAATRYVDIATGSNRGSGRTGLAGLVCTSGSPCVIQDADASRPSAWPNLELTNVAWTTVSNLNFSQQNLIVSAGFVAYGVAAYANGGACHDLTISGVSQTGSATSGMSDTVGAFFASQCTNVTYTNDSATWVGVGFTEGNSNSNFIFNNLRIRYFWNNAIFMSQGNGFTFNDTVVESPMRVVLGDHVDAFQLANANAVLGLTINRFVFAQADGTAFTQGPIFGGAGAGTGYTTGSQVVFTAGANFVVANTSAGTPEITDNCGSTKITSYASGSGGTSTWNISPSQTCGSSGSPVAIADATLTGGFNGVIYAGELANAQFLTGAGAFTAQNETLMQSVSNNYAFTDFTGYVDDGHSTGCGTAPCYDGVAGNVLTVTAMGSQYFTNPSDTTGNGTGPTSGIAACMYIDGAGLPNSGATRNYIKARVTGTGGVGTYTIGKSSACPPTTIQNYAIASQTFAATVDYIPSSVLSGGGDFALQSPSWAVNNVANTLFNPGGATLESIIVHNTTTTPTPTGWTYGSGICKGLQNPATYGPWFTGGDPAAAFAAITPTQWAAKNVTQVVDAVATAIEPTTGGCPDAGSGNWYGAVTTGGLWNDGSGKRPGH